MTEELEVSRMLDEGCPNHHEDAPMVTHWEREFLASLGRGRTEEDRLRDRVAELEAENARLLDRVSRLLTVNATLARELGTANKTILGLADRVTEQSELLSRAAERRIVTEDDGQPE